MTIDRHLKIAGVMQITQGVLVLVLSGFAVLLTVRDIERVVGTGWRESGAIIVWLPALVFALSLLIGGFQIWFGRSLANQKRWATRVVGFIWCFLGLFSFPIGTAINGYTLWVLVQTDKMEARMTEPASGHVH